MQYLRARYYNPAIGTFNRLDPFCGNMQDPQSLHKYLYVHGDPIQGIDPTGLMTIKGLLSTIGSALMRFATPTFMITSANVALKTFGIRSAIGVGFAAGTQLYMNTYVERAMAGLQDLKESLEPFAVADDVAAVRAQLNEAWRKRTLGNFFAAPIFAQFGLAVTVIRQAANIYSFTELIANTEALVASAISDWISEQGPAQRMAIRLALEIDGNTRFRLDVHRSKITYYGLTFQIHPETDLALLADAVRNAKSMKLTMAKANLRDFHSRINTYYGDFTISPRPSWLDE